MRLILAALLALATLPVAVPAFAFSPPNAAEVVRKVKKSVIRIAPVSMGEVAFASGYGGGSGVVFQIDYDKGLAWALTNHHVSGDAMLNSVRFWDGAEYKAVLVATEPGIDVALLEIHGIPDERDLPFEEKTIIAAPLGDADAVQIGEFAIAMGSPGSAEGRNSDRNNPWNDYMLLQTATMRVVTGKQTDPMDFMETWSYWKSDLGMQVMTNCPWRILTQSAINPGNSGGPLFNADGEVIGLNHAHFGAGSVITQNQNYTIPIDFAKNFAYQILNTGHYEIPWLGMDMFFPANYRAPQQISEFFERNYDEYTLNVFDVRDGSPAAQAGLRRGDVILEFDGQRFPTVSSFRQYVFDMPIGKTVPVVFERGGKKQAASMSVAPKRRYDSEFSL